jgi:hypothetical protein
MTYKELPTQKRLRELFIYDGVTGVLRKRKTNKVSGSKDSRGYLRSSVDGSRYKNSRLIWMYVYGECPPNMVIDHINRVVSDNRIDNIRLVNETENLKNKKKYINNSSGHTGVFWNKYRSKWCARFRLNGEVTQAGSFDTIEEAIKCRQEADLKYGFHNNHGS